MSKQKKGNRAKQSPVKKPKKPIKKQSKKFSAIMRKGWSEVVS